MRLKCEKLSEVLSFKKESNEIEAYHMQKKFKEGIKNNIAIEVKIQGGDQKTLKPTICKKFKEGIKYNIAIEVKFQGGDQGGDF